MACAANPHLNERDFAFLYASREAAEAERRQRRRRTAILRLGSAVGCLLQHWPQHGRRSVTANANRADDQAATAVAEKQRADSQAATAKAETARANRQRDIALARQLTIQARQMSAAEADRALLFSITAIRLADD